MTRTEILDLLQQWQTSFNERDPYAGGDLYAESVKLESPMAGQPTGLDGIRKVAEAFYAAFPDAVVRSEPPLIDGTRVAVVSKVSGTHVGAFMGLPPTGKPFHFSFVFLIEVGDGKIVRERRIYDFTGLLIQIGALKAKPA